MPRRMWAGGRLTFHAPLPLDTELVRHSTIVDVTEKWGSSGRLAFVTIRHEITVDGIAITTEEQDLVYREAAGQTPAPPAESPPSELCDAEHVVFPDSRLLFRFSALTFNAHRIHYDRPYACEVEGYGGLVVHGPLVATFLLHHGLAGTGFSKPAQFSFRARRPLIDGASIHFCRVVEGETTRLWARDAVGHVGMTAMLR